jgi:hypothetical protein
VTVGLSGGSRLSGKRTHWVHRTLLSRIGSSSTKSALSGNLSVFFVKLSEGSVRMADLPSGQVYRVLVTAKCSGSIGQSIRCDGSSDMNWLLLGF